MKGDEALLEIPGIVISALDDKTDSVVRAIKLVAENFLPKSFAPVILRARLEPCLTKKRWRDQGLEYIRGINRLTKTAEVLERGFSMTISGFVCGALLLNEVLPALEWIAFGVIIEGM